MTEEVENKKQVPHSLFFMYTVFVVLVPALIFKREISYLVKNPTYQVGQVFKICDREEYDPKDSTGVGSHMVVINHVNSNSVFYNVVGDGTTFSRTTMEFYELVNACK